jgi:catechol 2,3-dioxygenase-like lactoylglutathione lyase family enzyme
MRRPLEQTVPLTLGVDHVGLSVTDLERTKSFFCDCLGFKVVGGRPDYPAAFVSGGTTIVTLWQVEAPDACVGFDRRKNVGLHHLALRVRDMATLEAIHQRVSAWPGVDVEFSPQPMGKGPKMHLMIYEPSGVRIEFDCDTSSKD